MKFIIVLACSLGYAIARYIVFGTVEIANLPCYVVNKSVALSSVVALCFAAYHARANRTERERDWYGSFKVMLFLHVALSVVLFSPNYYPKMFAGGKMNLLGELFMLSGILATLIVISRTLVRDINVKTRTLQLLSAAAIASHNCFLGISGWAKWREWPGTMPPISMIGFIFALTTIALLYFSPTSRETNDFKKV